MGLEVLHPRKAADAKHRIHADLVAVHGLNGDAKRTWTHRETNALWLQDFLPQDVQNMRVMSFGYNASAAFGNTTATIADHARDLLGCLVDKREEGDEKTRPIIFVGHSLGGIVIKQALFQARIEPQYQVISEATVGIIFLGTPHRGSEKASYGKVLAKVATTVMHKPAPALVNALRANSDALMRLTTDFRFQLPQYQVCSFYEMKPMRIFSSLIVEKHSSVLDIPGEDQIPVDANHEEICKFTHPDDAVYEKLFKRVRRMLKSVDTDNRNTSNMPNALPYNQYYFVPHNSTGIFTGRDDILRKLHDCFFPNESRLASQKRFILYGLGGSGKTQTCTMFAEVHREMFWGIFWIDASTPMTIQQGFRDIGQRCGLGTEPDIVKQWLSNVQQHWLLIIDNADNPDMDISTIFPVGNRGSILVTTRNPRCTVHASAGSHELGEMGLEDGVKLFLRAANLEDASSELIQEEARAIVKTLGFLALAIVQAGAYVQQGLCSIDRYCDIYGRRRERLLNHLSHQAGSSYGFSVYTTWEVSLDAIKSRSDKTSKHAVELLQILGFFHHDNITDEIFERSWKNTRNEKDIQKNLAGMFYISEEGGSEWDPTSMIREAAVLLASFSLIKLDLIHHSMSMHPLVHAWARDRLSEDLRQHYRAAAGYTLSSAISKTFHASDYKFRRILVPHIDSYLQCSSTVLRYSDEDQVKMSDRFSLAFSENGRLRDSMELREKILAARQRTLGSECPNTLDAMFHLAFSYCDLGRYQEAMDLLEKTFEASQKTLGSEHPDTLRAMKFLATSYRDLGRHQEAMELYEKTFEARQRTLGNEHHDTLHAMTGLANSYDDLGRHQEAMELREKTFEASQRTLGVEHPNTLLAMNNLAVSYSDLGRHQDAMELLEKTFEATQRTLGSEHPDTLRTMNGLANGYGDLGRRQEAMELREKTFEASQRTLGVEHPNTLLAMNNLAVSYSDLGRHQDAMELEEKTLEASQRTLGSGHPDTLYAMFNLAYSYSDLGRREEAIALSRKAFEGRKRILGSEHPHTVDSMYLLEWCIKQPIKTKSDPQEKQSKIRKIFNTILPSR
ncbi:TPR-like protein [Elaphomyces granulatus]